MAPRVAVAGAAGRMGTAVCAAVEAADDLELAGRADPALGTTLADVLGDADVVVDFTRPDTALENALACRGRRRARRDRDDRASTCRARDPRAGAGRPAANVFVGPELRDRRGADDALRRRGLAAHGQGRDHRAAPRRQARRAERHGGAHGRADGGRRADPLRAPARARRPPGGHPRRRGPDADDPPRLDRTARRSCRASCSPCGAWRTLERSPVVGLEHLLFA